MSSAIWNRLFSGSAAQPADHGDDSSAQRPAGDLTMKGVSLKWSTSPARWKDSSPICAEHLHDAPLMQKLAISRTTLREIPWRRILEHVLTMAATNMSIPFDAPKLLSAVVEAARLSTLEHLASYLHDWRAISGRVQAVLDWHSSPKEMCERSRPGAYLADCMITELKVHEHGANATVHYHVVYNAEYHAMGHEMGIVKNGNSSANNVGNQLECLCWVALEEDRPLWIIALVWHAAQLEQRKKRKPAATVILSTESDSDVHPVHETQAATAQRNSSASRPASPPDHPKPERVHIPALIELEAGHVEAACGMVYEAHLTRGFQLEQDMEDAKQSFNATQASRAASGDPDSDEHPAPVIVETESESDSDEHPASVTTGTESDSDAHPANTSRQPATETNSHSDAHADHDGYPFDTTSPTPLWDRFLENLQLASDGEQGRAFVKFLQNHCFRRDLLFKDSFGNSVQEKIPLGVKMESLFKTAWRRRQLALERLRRNGWTVNDETHELSDDDMTNLPQLLSPKRRILIVCAVGGEIGQQTAV